MNDTKIIKDQQIPFKDNIYNNLIEKPLPILSLPNQTGNLLKLNRSDTFRLVVYFYSLTGNPTKKLPKNWNQIPGAKGCTQENILFRDKYEDLLLLNALPIGVSTQKVEEINEMTKRLGIQHDILSDSDLLCAQKLSLPTFAVDNKNFIKRLTIIVEKNIIKSVFYPIVSINKHVNDVLEWLRKN